MYDLKQERFDEMMQILKSMEGNMSPVELQLNISRLSQLLDGTRNDFDMLMDEMHEVYGNKGIGMEKETMTYEEATGGF